MRNMRELELIKQNLNFKILHLEEKMADHAENTLDAVTHRIKELAFETGFKIITNLFFNKWKKGKNKSSNESE
ncbi:MAG TPA: hypothetical protein VKA27_11045 [Sunxiuqinia sp.]|nr:hypothetical protein [Sunxiuqinia sp.]